MSPDDFTKLTRYRCRWCGKLFATDKKHDCKFHPDKRNCLSCKRCSGVEDGEIEGVNGHYIPAKRFICDVDALGDADEMYLVTFSHDNWKGFCDEYDPLPDYTGSKSYSDNIVRKAIEREFNEPQPF